jgi:Golgi nucleoside diphosphatase
MAKRSTVGMIVDAGSGGSRLHIYKWNKRVFHTPYPPISYPSTDEQWTDVMVPGVSTFADSPEQILGQLKSMIYYAKQMLVDKEEDWCFFPIYFKATGGMREVPLSKRERLMAVIRGFFSDRKENPFYFESEFARVISGEEEAVYAWTGANYLMGSLLPPLEEQYSLSDSVHSGVQTYGVLDLGGASTQIAFYVPNQEITEGLFKLQIGNRKHWNLYTKSFLQFGHNSIQQRHLEDITNTFLQSSRHSVDSAADALTACYHAGYSEDFFNKDEQRWMTVRGPVMSSSTQMAECIAVLKPLLMLNLDRFCEWVYDGECGIAGQYQPNIPPESEMKFIGLSSYKLPWSAFDMPPTASLHQFAKRADKICSMDFEELVIYYSKKHSYNGKELDLAQMPYHCFLGSYVVVLLTEGYGFGMNHTLTVIDEYNGNKVAWTLGSILYEINSMPWTYSPPILADPTTATLLAGNIGLLLGALLAWIFMRHLNWNEADLRGKEENDERSLGTGGRAPRQDEDWSSKIVQFFPSFGQQQQQSYEDIPSHVSAMEDMEA